MNVPCPSCPWRKSSTVGGSDIPNFNLDKMRNLACTVGDGDAFRPVMACHYSPDGEEYACVGYLAIEGYSNINVRLMAARGDLDLRAIWAQCEALDLWPSFSEMLAEYEAAASEATR